MTILVLLLPVTLSTTVLNCPKEALITPVNEHWTSEDTEYGHLLWIKETLVNKSMEIDVFKTIIAIFV